MCIQNYCKQITFLTFILVVQICNTTTLISPTLYQKVESIDEEKNLQFDQIDSKLNTDDISSTSSPPEVSKQTMDIITVIWYLSTFLALAAFFFLMACSDRRCGRNRRSANNSNQLDDDQQVCPPTPSPSYSEFAPPSYESVVKENSHIYVVPIVLKLSEEKTRNPTELLMTDCKIHTINEMHKNSV